MSDDDLKYLHQKHSTGQDKYTYFLLAVTASAIAFAVQKTETSVISYALTPIGIAVMSWCASFYCGCKNLVWVQTTLMANYNLLQLRMGVHPEQPENPEHLEVAKKGVRSALESNADKAQEYAIAQYRLLIIGAVFFLIWHIVEIIIRTNAS
jgi:hypothetical protein